MSVKIERRIGIQASEEVAWEVLSDIPAWGEWTGLYPRVEGEIRIGAPWSMDIALPGLPVRTINPVVLDWAPYDHIHLRMDSMRGWVRTIRYFEFEKMGEANLIFSNGELFTGLLGASAARKNRRPMIDALEAMNEALRTRCEAIWRERNVSGK